MGVAPAAGNEEQTCCEKAVGTVKATGGGLVEVATAGAMVEGSGTAAGLGPVENGCEGGGAGVEE